MTMAIYSIILLLVQPLAMAESITEIVDLFSLS